MIVCVPRLTASLVADPSVPPIGREVWNDTLLYVPFAQNGATYRNIFSGESITVTEPGGLLALPVGEVLKDFPVALLERRS